MIEKMTRAQLRAFAKAVGIKGYGKVSKVADLRRFIAASGAVNWDARYNGLRVAVDRLARRVSRAKDRPGKHSRNISRLEMLKGRLAYIESLAKAS